jgi:hypothetical protein
MKTEQEILERIQTLITEGSLPSLMMIIVLLWVLDTRTDQLNRYISLLDVALKEISNAITPNVDSITEPEVSKSEQLGV